MPQATLTMVTEVTPSTDLDYALAAFQKRVRETREPFSLIKGLHFARLAVVGGDEAQAHTSAGLRDVLATGAPRLRQAAGRERWLHPHEIYAHCTAYKPTIIPTHRLLAPGSLQCSAVVPGDRRPRPQEPFRPYPRFETRCESAST